MIDKKPDADLSPSAVASLRRTWDLQTDGSILLAQALTYQFLAALTPELLRRGMRYEVLRGDFDLSGHDVVIEADGVMRHIQLKGMADGGKTRKVPINTLLSAKPSGCVVWLNYDRSSLAITGWRWFGGPPGQKLPALGGRSARHTRANGIGKAYRPNMRVLTAGKFTRISNVSALADRLFGPEDCSLLRRHLRKRAEPAEGWLAQVQSGNFAALPADLGWALSGELAHLIHGYDLAEELGLGDPFEYESRQLKAAERSGSWSGNAAELWVTLFLEHRRWRFSSPCGPDAQMAALLDKLVCQLRCALTGQAS